MSILQRAHLEPGVVANDNNHATILCKLIHLALLPTVGNITPMFLWLKRSLAIGSNELHEPFDRLINWF